ncbi:MAG TPA: hypothetical protein VHW25_00710 [Steroidobacteraceae bacterium]|jgi:hypothetical protein|nr:hypothetical protein [Steroidobacteraceae bacterium]
MRTGSFSTRSLALILVLLCTSGCATIGKWKQEHREASLHRQQTEEAAAHNTESKAERVQRLKEAQDAARLPLLQRELAARSDPDSLAASAVIEGLISGFDSSAARELAGRAAGAAPDRAELALLQLQLCESAPTCDPLPLEQHLRLLDPANGVTWIYALLRADREHRPQDWETARAGLAQAQRVDLYWNRIVSHLAKAVAGKAGFDSEAALVEVVGAETALMSALQPIAQACQSQELQRPGVLEQCRRIAAALRHGDTTVIEADGSSLALRLWPQDSAERRAVVSERRVLRYRVDLMTHHATQLNSPHAIGILAGLLTQYPSEQATMHALYVQLGLKPDPPADWVDPRPDG